MTELMGLFSETAGWMNASHTELVEAIKGLDVHDCDSLRMASLRGIAAHFSLSANEHGMLSTADRKRIRRTVAAITASAVEVTQGAIEFLHNDSPHSDEAYYDYTGMFTSPRLKYDSDWFDHHVDLALQGSLERTQGMKRHDLTDAQLYLARIATVEPNTNLILEIHRKEMPAIGLTLPYAQYDLEFCGFDVHDQTANQKF